MLKTGSGIGLLANGTSTFDVQALSARDWSRNGIGFAFRFASDGIVGRRSAARPRSSLFETSARAWVTNGIDCSIVGSDDFVAGRASRANWRSEGRASLSDARAGLPTLITLSSAGIAARRF